jgi:hypothetical protein
MTQQDHLPQQSLRQQQTPQARLTQLKPQQSLRQQQTPQARLTQLKPQQSLTQICYQHH